MWALLDETVDGGGQMRHDLNLSSAILATRRAARKDTDRPTQEVSVGGGAPSAPGPSVEPAALSRELTEHEPRSHVATPSLGRIHS